jgi:hypothetical protein
MSVSQFVVRLEGKAIFVVASFRLSFALGLVVVV